MNRARRVDVAAASDRNVTSKEWSKPGDSRLGQDSMSPPPLCCSVVWGPSCAAGGASSLVGGGGQCVGGKSMSALYPEGASFNIGCRDGLGEVWSACNATLGGALKTYLTSASDAFATSQCSANEDLVGGGCSCPTSIRASYPAGSSWVCNCEPVTGVTARAYAICVDRTGAVTPVQGTKGLASCTSGMLVGGGCDCGTFNLIMSLPTASSWACGCAGAPPVRTVALCATAE